LQFAAIRTDDALNEIVRFEIRSRLLRYVIPSPRAMQVTDQTIDDLLD
jgi:exonuclease I